MKNPLLLALPFVAACTVDFETSGVTQEAGCTKLTCGDNTSFLGVLPFHELHPTETSPDGLQIVEVRSKVDKPMTITVSGAQLIGYGDGSVFAEQDLVDTTLTIKDTVNAKLYEVTIIAVGSTDYYEDGNGTVETYKLVYKEVGTVGTPRMTCTEDRSKSIWGGSAYHSVIFAGDRYNINTGALSATGAAAGEWFNIACIGDAKAKMLAIRHAEAAQAPGYKTSQDQRTAALRMFRADYCGTGTPYTVPGVKLDWENVGGWNYIDAANKPITPANVEAIWAADGAVCLSNPRLAKLEDVLKACPKEPEPCSKELIAVWQEKGGHLITVIP